MCGPFLLSYAASWTRPASVLFQTSGDHARHASAGCLLDRCGVRCLPGSGDAPRMCPAMPCVRLLPDVGGSRPHAPRPSAGRVRCPLSFGSGDHARHAPAGCLLDGCGVRCLPVSGDTPRHAPRPSSSRRRRITPACPASVQALRYYRAGGRANGRHPRLASLFLKF